MGKIYLTLAVVTLAVTLAFPAVQSLADDAADIEAVERELEAEAMAVELYKRAHNRALKAVGASSLAREHEKLAVQRDEAWNAYKDASSAADEARAKEDDAWNAAHEAERIASWNGYGAKGKGIDARLKAGKEWRAADKTRPYAMSLSEKAGALAKVAHTLFDAYIVASGKVRAQNERRNLLVNNMTSKFLLDEIARAVERGLDELERELREINKRVKKGLTI